MESDSGVHYPGRHNMGEIPHGARTHTLLSVIQFRGLETESRGQRKNLLPGTGSCVLKH